MEHLECSNNIQYCGRGRRRQKQKGNRSWWNENWPWSGCWW